MKTHRVLWLIGLLLTCLVAYFNQGIIALDDYSEGVARFIPAQQLSFAQNIETTGIRFPFQSLMLLLLSKLALGFGITDPTGQMRFVLLILGFTHFAIQTFCATRFFKTEPEKRMALLLSAFYFVMPLLYTRPLIENMSGAWITLAAYAAYRYQHELHSKWIVLSVFSIACSALFRFQAGVCIFAVPLLFWILKTPRGWIPFFISGGLAFVLTGFLDQALTGGFHRSLLSYVNYNLEHASSYGTTPFYTFALLFLGLSLPPTFFGKYPGFLWKERYQRLLAVLLFFGVFFISHSLIPHKEERFMIPVLVLFLVLLTPLLVYWLEAPKGRWRVIYFFILNTVLLIPASFSTPQNNVIGLVQFLNHHPEIKRLINYNDSVVLIPRAFALHTFEVLPMKPILAPISLDISCDSVIAVRQDLASQDGWQDGSFKQIAEFKPGFLEALLVKLNPRQNGRRGSIFLYASPECNRG
ncbi:hypothetical protein EBR78_01870 [bacterium]|nr:hypothetical protein [bacterium]